MKIAMYIKRDKETEDKSNENIKIAGKMFNNTVHQK